MDTWLKIFYIISLILFVGGFIANKISMKKEEERIKREENIINNINND